MSTQEPDMRAAARQWNIILGGVIGAFVIAIAVAAYLTFGRTPPPTPEQIAAEQAKHLAVENTKVCKAAMKAAQSFGIVPPFRQAHQSQSATDRCGGPLRLRGGNALGAICAEDRSDL
jgi:hypothetical protein